MGAVITGPDAGAVGSGPGNAGYITRSSAVAEDEGERLSTHNVPDDVKSGSDETWEQQRIRLRTWAEQVKQEEKARHGNRSGQPRTHYRTVLSYEGKIPAYQAQQDAQEFLEEAFPDAKAFSVVHQDTDHTHVHIWMSARKVDGKKIHIGKGDIQEINRTWDEIYQRRAYRKEEVQFGGDLVRKMREAQDFKRKYAQLRDQGASEAELEQWAKENRPKRAIPPGPQVYRERDLRHGVETVAQRAEAEQIEDRLHEDRSAVIEQVEKNLEERHGTRHDRGSEGAEREANPDRQATGPGERTTSEQSRGADSGADRERAPGRSGRDRRGSEGDQKRDEHGKEQAENGRFEDVGGQQEPEQREGGSGGPDGPADGNSDSFGSSGRSGDAANSEMGNRASVDSGGGSGSSSSDLGDSQGEGSYNVRKHLAEGENAEAARVFDRLDREDQERLSQTLTKKLKGELRKGRFKADREAGGTEEAYQALSSNEQELVAGIQASERGILPDEEAEKVREAIQSLDEGQANAVREALPSDAQSVFEKIKQSTEQSEEQSESQDKSESEDQDRSKGSDLGHDRGMSL